MALSRPALNVIDGANTVAGTADNPSLNAIDVWFDAADVKATLMACWAGPLPTITGTGLEFRVPKVSGASVTFNLSSLYSRLESLASAAGVQFTVEKSPGGSGAFSPTSIGSNTHGTTDREKESVLTGTITSGDLVRINYVNVSGGNGGVYNVELIALEQ